MYNNFLETRLKNKNKVGKFTGDISGTTAQGKQIPKSNFQQIIKKKKFSEGKPSLIQYYCNILAEVSNFQQKYLRHAERKK